MAQRVSYLSDLYFFCERGVGLVSGSSYSIFNISFNLELIL
jgi:hypothetical protein